MRTRVIQDESETPTGNDGAPNPLQEPGSPAPSHNLAARMGRWSAQHRAKAIFGWLALMFGLFVISIVSPMKMIEFETSGPGESGRADTILFEDFKQPAGEQVLVQSTSLTASDPEFQATVQDVVDEVGRLDVVKKVESPFASG